MLLMPNNRSQRGCLLPRGVQLKPISLIQTMRDYKEHREIELNWKFYEWVWTSIGTCNDLKSATSC